MDILILLLLIALNGVLAMSEIAIVSSRKVRLAQQAEKGNRGAAAALRLAASPTRFLSTVQIGITLIGIVMGAFGEAAIAGDLTERLGRSSQFAPYAHIMATAIVVLAIFYLSLVLGELVPKRLALNNPERIAAFIAPPMRTLSWLTAPLVHFLSFSTDLVLKIFGSKASKDAAVTEQDIRDLIQQGTAAGLFLEKERELVERIFRLGDQRVSALMVPRADITWLEADAPVDRVRLAVATSSHSHFPVCTGGLDNLVGVVHLKDMVQAGLLQVGARQQAPDSAGEAEGRAPVGFNLRLLSRKPLFVPETMPALRLVEEFRKAELHIAFVLDEYGVIAGLITLNDLVEAMLGQMARHGEEDEPMAVQRADGSWLLDGGMPVEDLKSLMEVEALPGQERTSFNTLAGFVMTYLARVPRTGDAFTYDRFRFEVVDMDRHRIDKVLFSFTKSPAPRRDTTASP